MWNLFYHLLIPEGSLATIQKHARCLIHASNSLQEWQSSPFGQFIDFLGSETLTQIRRIWVSYATVNESEKSDERARSTIKKRGQQSENAQAIHGIRAAGPFWIDAAATMTQMFQEYWKTGVVGGNPKDVADLGKGARGSVNPTFSVSSAPAGDYAVHYGLEPLLGFHLAQCFSNSAVKISAVNTTIIDVAKAQFKAWCSSFKKYVAYHRVHLIFHSGEAVALCYLLQLHLSFNYQSAGSPISYAKPWSSIPLVLDGIKKLADQDDLPLGGFDVVDTSNLSDHVGLINILAATTPLLRKSPFAVLYTESLLKASKRIDKSLSDVLGSDVATFSLLLGIAPTGLLSGVTMEAVSNEMALSMISQSEKGAQQQYRMRIPWRKPEFTDPMVVKSVEDLTGLILGVEIDPKVLADYLFKLYLTVSVFFKPFRFSCCLL